MPLFNPPPTAANIGLSNVNNTSDANKPVSTATQTVLDGKQTLDSDLTTIAGLTATTNNFMIAVSSAWASRTPTQATALLDAFTSGLKGLVPASGGGTTNFLRADGSFAAPTAAAANPTYTPNSFTVAAGEGRHIIKRMQLTTTERATIQGTTKATSGRLVLSN